MDSLAENESERNRGSVDQDTNGYQVITEIGVMLWAIVPETAQ